MSDENYFEESAKRFLKTAMAAKRNPISKKAKELSAGEKGMLAFLSGQEEGITAGEISRRTGIGTGGVANVLNMLEKKGYIERRMSPSDRRSVQVFLSDTGRDLVRAKQQEVITATARLLQRMGREDTEELIRLLEKASALCREMEMEEQTEHKCKKDTPT